MHKEIEAQFLEIDKDAVRQKLKALGAKLILPETLMKRVIFAIGPHEFARVRDEGNSIVMTYKNVKKDSTIDGTEEINLKIDNYDHGVAFLKACGLKEKAYQETLRETWILDGVEICLDTWPWIPSYAEIEGPSADSVWSVAKSLGFDPSAAFFGSVDTKYQHYYGVDPDVVNHSTPTITFDCPPPSWVKN